MSGLVKGAKKVFKKVTKVVKRVLPIVLAAAAIYFTAGAAMGFAPAAGGWAGAAASMTSGLTGTLGSVVTGAVTQAGQAAAIGGLMSEATGGKFADGARQGAVAGAVLGGVSGFASGPAVPAMVEGSAVTDGAGGHFANMSPAPVAPGTMQAAAQGNATGLFSNAPNVQPGVQGFGQSVKGLMQGVGEFAKENPAITGGIIQGLGTGFSAQAQADEERKAEERKRKQIEHNYSGQDFSGYRQFASPQAKPQERSSARFLDYEYAYNPETARIERKQRA